MFSKEVIALAKLVVEAIKKISKGKWEWEPELGEWFISTPTGEIYLIDNDTLMEIKEDKKHSLNIMLPILPWEKIEKILWELGYWMRVRKLEKNRCQAMIGRLPCHNQVHRWVTGKNYTEATQKAIIKVVKEKNISGGD